MTLFITGGPTFVSICSKQPQLSDYQILDSEFKTTQNLSMTKPTQSVRASSCVFFVNRHLHPQKRQGEPQFWAGKWGLFEGCLWLYDINCKFIVFVKRRAKNDSFVYQQRQSKWKMNQWINTWNPTTNKLFCISNAGQLVFKKKHLQGTLLQLECLATFGLIFQCQTAKNGRISFLSWPSLQSQSSHILFLSLNYLELILALFLINGPTWRIIPVMKYIASNPHVCAISAIWNGSSPIVMGLISHF